MYRYYSGHKILSKDWFLNGTSYRSVMIGYSSSSTAWKTRHEKITVLSVFVIVSCFMLKLCNGTVLFLTWTVRC